VGGMAESLDALRWLAMVHGDNDGHGRCLASGCGLGDVEARCPVGQTAVVELFMAGQARVTADRWPGCQ
jgi:hypothetical protein